MIYLVAFACAVAVCAWNVRSRRRGLPLPPGPPRLPVLGNILHIPRRFEWLQYTSWGQQYGPLVYLELLGQPLLIVNSNEVAVDLLEKRSQIYSDRPKLRMAGELVGWDRGVTLIASGERHRRYRRLLHSALSSGAVASLYPVLESEALLLLDNLREFPADFISILRRSVGRTIVRVAYGHGGDGGEDYIDLAEVAQDNFSRAATPYTYMVDYVPILKAIPPWLPGGRFIAQARQWRRELDHLAHKPVRVVKDRLASGDIDPCYVSAHLEAGADEEDVTWSAASLFTGGADTTVSSLASFFLAMCLYPQAKQRAQEEVDAVLQREGAASPMLAHREMMPYVNACVAELLRWQPVIPLGVAHRAIQDDEYQGYVIPAGTTVIANTWALTRDPSRFPNPDEFVPERYLVDSLRTEGFGFGRRICPGRLLAEASIFIAVANILAAFDILPPLDENGTPKVLPLSFTSGLISHPERFECRILPRRGLGIV